MIAQIKISTSHKLHKIFTLSCVGTDQTMNCIGLYQSFDLLGAFCSITSLPKMQTSKCFIN